MNKQEIMLKINKIKFKAVKNSPTIFMYAGAAGVIGASILACRSTLKLTSILDKSKETLNSINETVENEALDYTQEDSKKDKIIVYTSTALDIAKLYAPSVILGGISLAAMIQSHNILNRRNAALAAAFTTATETLNRYRKNVVDRFGEEVDYELRHGIKKEKVTVEETDENGKTKKVKKTVDVADGNNNYVSDYARYFDESCDGWSEDPECNLMFLKAQQQYANDKLVAQGYLFLNDVYRMLGFEDSKAGQVVGWVYDPDNQDGDNYVDFGLYDVSIPGYRDDITNDTISEERRDFVNNHVSCVLLDFNVDGNIWEKMGK